MNTDADSARLQANQDAYAIVEDRVLKLARQHGRDVAIAAMKRFGVERAYSMAPAHYSQFIIVADEILLGATWVPVEDKPAARSCGDGCNGCEVCTDYTDAPTDRERIRPALTWAESQPFDAFPGFVVPDRYTGYIDWPDCTQGPLQRLSDTSTPAVNPAHAMAAVLGRVGG